jgi:non-specific serine/threonine protein kinase
LLNEPERLLLARLSVFQGGWRLDSAEAICAGDEIEEWEVLDLLSSLVDKSLVVYGESEGVARYRLLETVRQYARERLEESGQSEAVHARHRDGYLALAEEAEPKLTGLDQTKWFRRLGEEHDNLRAALEWSLDESGSRGAVRICRALRRFWWTWGFLSEGRAWNDRALASEAARERNSDRADALASAGRFAQQLGDGVAAETYLKESLDICREAGDRAGVAIALSCQGHVEFDRGNLSGARSLFEQSLAIRREVGEPYDLSFPLYSLGLVATYTGNLVAAKAYLEECLAIRREIGDRYGAAFTLGILGDIALILGDYATAHSLFRENLLTVVEIGERNEIVSFVERFARLAIAQSDFRRAATFLGAASAFREKMGTPLPRAVHEQFDEDAARGRRVLGEDAYAAEFARGRAMTLDEAVALALEGST